TRTSPNSTTASSPWWSRCARCASCITAHGSPAAGTIPPSPPRSRGSARRAIGRIASWNFGSRSRQCRSRRSYPSNIWTQFGETHPAVGCSNARLATQNNTRPRMSTAPETPPADAGLSRRRWFIPALVVGGLALAGLAAWYFWPKTSAEMKAETGSGKGKGGGGGARKGGFDPNRVQPVTAVAAKIADINIVQTALGTVTSGRTALVKPRVAFREGDSVAAGAQLAQIDPVPLQVQLAQVQGQLARDAAQLNNARLDLERYRKLFEQDSIAGQQVDQQAALVKQLEGTVKVD